MTIYDPCEMVLLQFSGRDSAPDSPRSGSQGAYAALR